MNDNRNYRTQVMYIEYKDLFPYFIYVFVCMFSMVKNMRLFLHGYNSNPKIHVNITINMIKIINIFYIIYLFIH